MAEYRYLFPSFHLKNYLDGYNYNGLHYYNVDLIDLYYCLIPDFGQHVRKVFVALYRIYAVNVPLLFATCTCLPIQREPHT